MVREVWHEARMTVGLAGACFISHMNIALAEKAAVAISAPLVLYVVSHFSSDDQVCVPPSYDRPLMDAPPPALPPDDQIYV